MTVRVGVDVGGTFTKAVACDAADGRIVARSIIPTTHTAANGVAAGVASALEAVAAEVEAGGLGPIALVTHSSTQAVNALLEGDTATVGILAVGHRPDLERTRKRTALGPIGLAPGRSLRTVSTLIDGTDGLDPQIVAGALDDLMGRGAEAIVVSAAFGAEDPSIERAALEVANAKGLPACAGHELSGLYGLELRTVTGAINASILPIALRAAGVVEIAVERIAPDAALLVMRGDGGAADMATMRRRPLTTAFSGPAASVSGALRRMSLGDAIAIEVGGTSTNVALIRGGRPVLSYVRVLEHQTGVRSLDVRVVGVAGGSLLRVGRRFGRPRISDVGPRSAHIAGLAYATFSSAEVLEHARAILVAPRPGDAADYVVLQAADGRTFAPTVTCAANALGVVDEGSYAVGDGAAARVAFERVGELVGEPWDRVAQRVLALATAKISEVVEELVSGEKLRAPAVVGIGGGSGAVVPALAGRLGLGWQIAPDAEVLSSVGDALSMVRVEIERGAAKPTPELIAELHREAEAQAIAAGADPDSVQVESERIPDRAAIRVTATGAVALRSGQAASGAAPTVDLATSAANALGSPVERHFSGSHYSLFVPARAGRDRGESRFALMDNRGGLSSTGRGRFLLGTGDEVANQLRATLPGLVRHLGPITVAPAVRIVRGPRVVDLGALSNVDEILAAAITECGVAGDEPVVALIVRS